MAIRTTPKAIFEKLSRIAPDIEFNVEWVEDPSFAWDGDGPDPREEGYIPHDVLVTASAVFDGEEKVGRAGLGGSYDKPDKQDPDIHGYLPQLLRDALRDLMEKQEITLGPREWTPRQEITEFLQEFRNAENYLTEVLRVRYEAAMKKGR